MAGGDIVWRASLNDDPFRSSMDKIVGITDQKGKMVVRTMRAAMAGAATSFGLALKGIDEYAKRNDVFASELQQAKYAWSDMWSAIGEGVYVSGVLEDVTQKINGLVIAYRSLHGTETLAALDEAIAIQKDKRADEMLRRAEAKTSMAMMRAGGADFEIAKLQAAEEYRQELERINELVKEYRLSENQASALRGEALKKREIDIGAARGTDGLKRWEEEKSRLDEVYKNIEKEQKLSDHDLDVRNSLTEEKEMIRIDALKRKGYMERALLLENEIKRKKALNELDRDEMLTVRDRQLRKDQVNDLYDTRAQDIDQQRFGNTQNNYAFQPLSALYDRGAYSDLYAQAGSSGGVVVDVKAQTVTQKAMLKELQDISRKLNNPGGATFQ